MLKVNLYRMSLEGCISRPQLLDVIFCRISQDFENNSVILSGVGVYLAMISLLEGF